MEQCFFLPDGEKWNKESSGAPLSQDHSAVKGDVMSDSKGDFSFSFVIISEIVTRYLSLQNILFIACHKTCILQLKIIKK